MCDRGTEVQAGLPLPGLLPGEQRLWVEGAGTDSRQFLSPLPSPHPLGVEGRRPETGAFTPADGYLLQCAPCLLLNIPQWSSPPLPRSRMIYSVRNFVSHFLVPINHL